MKNKFITKKTRIKIKRLFTILMISIGIIINYKLIQKTKEEITNKEFIDLVVNNTYDEDDIIERIVNKSLEISNPIKLLNKEYTKYTKEEQQVIKEEIAPIIYIYNSHQTEEYQSTDFVEFTVNPTVMMNDYIMEDIFNKNGYKTIVEETSIKEILNKNNWKYSSSYKASRILLEDSIIKYPSLKYFIDVHRDSITKDKTTIEIDGKQYAKILFIVGMENNNYQYNLEFTEKLNNKLNELYPKLSKGIYKKSGPGVNGIYNQDFSPNTILVEIGGFQNTTTEVLNTSIAFSKCFMEVINEKTS